MPRHSGCPTSAQGIAEANWSAWHVDVGDDAPPRTKPGEVMTDKATVELPLLRAAGWCRDGSGQRVRGRADPTARRRRNRARAAALWLPTPAVFAPAGARARPRRPGGAPPGAQSAASRSTATGPRTVNSRSACSRPAAECRAGAPPRGRRGNARHLALPAAASPAYCRSKRCIPHFLTLEELMSPRWRRCGPTSTHATRHLLFRLTPAALLSVRPPARAPSSRRSARRSTTRPASSGADGGPAHAGIATQTPQGRRPRRPRTTAEALASLLAARRRLARLSAAAREGGAYR